MSGKGLRFAGKPYRVAGKQLSASDKHLGLTGSQIGVAGKCPCFAGIILHLKKIGSVSVWTKRGFCHPELVEGYIDKRLRQAQPDISLFFETETLPKNRIEN